jgi:hypothetical protein
LRSVGLLDVADDHTSCDRNLSGIDPADILTTEIGLPIADGKIIIVKN